MKKALLIIALLSASAFAEDNEQEYSNWLPDYIEHIQRMYPNASLDELDELVKSEFTNHNSLRYEADDGSDLDYSGVVDEHLPTTAKLNDTEKALFNDSPWKGLLVINSGRLARDSALGLYSEGLWNGNADAYRHCYWNNLMVMNTTQEFAKAWGNAHEEIPDNPPLEKWMDISNNNDGRRLAENHRSDSDKERSSRCLDGVVKKRLVRIVNNKVVPTDGTGRK